MKTIAEKIATLKDAETQAYERYMEVMLKEANALGKRLGMEEITYSDIQQAYCFVLDNCEEGKNTIHYFQLPMLVSIVRIVKSYPYVIRIHDKWANLGLRIEQLKDLLK